jgi:tetratricopeptide (TPR) repeat protein
VSPGKAAAIRAVEMDDALAEVHNSLAGKKFWFDWDWSAGKDFEKAIEINPGYALARFWYAEYLAVMGRIEEALEQAKRARELDPLSPIINTSYAIKLRALRRYDESTELLKKSLELEPNFLPAHRNLALNYNQLGLNEESLAEIKTIHALAGNTEVVEALERGYADSGYKGALLAAAEKLTEQSKTYYVRPTTISSYYALAEEAEKSLRWLERAYDERHPFLVHVKIYPEWESIHSHPRFQELIRRMNLPE